MLQTIYTHIKTFILKHKYISILIVTFVSAGILLCCVKPAQQTTPGTINPGITTEEASPGTTPSQPVSIYEGYTTLFGDNSLSMALVGKSYKDFSEYDKEVLHRIVDAANGAITIDTTHVVLAGSDGRQSIYYPDGTRIIVDTYGQASGTRWIDTELSGMLTQPELTVFQCVASEGVFAVKYTTTDTKVYTSYCSLLQEQGFNLEMFTSDVMFSAMNAEGYEVAVSYTNNTLTIMLKAPSTNTLT